MKIRLFAILLVLAMLAGLLPAVVQAQEVVDSGICGPELTWKLYDNGKTLQVSGIGDMRKDMHEGPWYLYAAAIERVIIDDGVTSIGTGAFKGCTSLTEITLPESIRSIQACAFENCTSLTTITIPEGLLDIRECAFVNCTSLTAITIPENVTSIGGGAFQGCSSLAFYVYDNGKYLGSSQNPYYFLIETVNDDITDCTIHPQTKVIVNDAFRDCVKLTNITIPEMVMRIGACGFYNCTSLSHITIPGGMFTIGNFAFHGCVGLTDVYYTGTESRWTSVMIEDNNEPLLNATIHYGQFTGSCGDQVIWQLSKDKKTLQISGIGDMWKLGISPWSEYSADIECVILHDGVTSIGQFAFGWFPNLKEVTIPDSVTLIGDYAFYNCSKLANVYYSGTRAQWNAITIEKHNTYLTNAIAFEGDPPGDVTGDGKINLADVAKTFAHIRGSTILTGETELLCADVTGDGKVNLADVARIFAHVRGKKPLY